LDALVESGQLRPDLFHRLNGVTVVVPSLRGRKSDIPALLQHFLNRAAARSQARAPEVDAGVLRALMHHDWPGNVRELENMATRMWLYVDAGRISVAGLSKDKDLSSLLSRTLPPRSAGRGSKVVDRLAERIDIERALATAAGNREQAAKRLGISRATLYRRLRELGLR
jgi:DNA-binding NtrC family response regulator